MMATVLAPLLMLTVLAGAARFLTGGPLSSKVDAVALTVAAMAPGAVMWQWPAGNAPAVTLSCAGLWFLWRTGAPRKVGTAAPGGGRGAALYRFLFAGAALWITFSLASTHALGPGGQLGSILLHMFAAVALVFAAAAWLLGTFAMPQGSTGKIRPAVGIHEALASAVVALCFFSLV